MLFKGQLEIAEGGQVCKNLPFRIVLQLDCFGYSEESSWTPESEESCDSMVGIVNNNYDNTAEQTSLLQLHQ